MTGTPVDTVIPGLTGDPSRPLITVILVLNFLTVILSVSEGSLQ